MIVYSPYLWVKEGLECRLFLAIYYFDVICSADMSTMGKHRFLIQDSRDDEPRRSNLDVPH